jgi:acid phosphatase type 7
MVIGYITSDMTAASSVRYGTSSGSYPNVVTGNSTSYTYGKYKSGQIHHVWLTGLSTNTKYYYQAGSDAAWSQEFTFTSNPGIGPNIPYTFAVVADIGENANANNTITHVLASADTIDSVIIAGDISYASGCESNGCTTWDAFQTMAAPLAAIKPWQINIGNHGKRTSHLHESTS